MSSVNYTSSPCFHLVFSCFLFYFDSAVSLYFLCITLCFCFPSFFVTPDFETSAVPLTVVSCASLRSGTNSPCPPLPAFGRCFRHGGFCVVVLCFSQGCVCSVDVGLIIVVSLVSSCSGRGCLVLPAFSVSVLVVWIISGSGVSFGSVSVELSHSRFFSIFPLVEFLLIWNKWFSALQLGVVCMLGPASSSPAPSRDASTHAVHKQTKDAPTPHFLSKSQVPSIKYEIHIKFVNAKH